jgi:threonine dehydratase
VILDKSEIEAAEKRIRKFLSTTPILYSRHYSARVGANVFLKLETLQPIHSFKVCGAFNAILALSDEQKKQGVVRRAALRRRATQDSRGAARSRREGISPSRSAAR